MTRRVKIALASCGIVLSLVVAGASGWVASEYAAGRDPFALAASALATTTEAGEGRAPSSEGNRASASGEGGRSANGSPEKKPGGHQANESSTDEATSVEDGGATGSFGAHNDAQGSSDAHGRGTSEPASSQDAPTDASSHGDVGHVDDNENGAGGSSDGGAVDNTVVSVTVTVDASLAGGAAYTQAVSLPAGATAYDALVATGAAVNARATAFGTYVAAIDGVAEKEHGGMSGWVYAVGGVEPNTAASNYVLSDGDVMVWTYVNVEY